MDVAPFGRRAPDNRAGMIHPVSPESAWRWGRMIARDHPEGGRGTHVEGNARGIDAVGADVARRPGADCRKPACGPECTPAAPPRRAQPAPPPGPGGEPGGVAP